ncbi:MAG: hypothetical protein LBI20_03745 [Holosporales bacterium]|nr:hypothetical protein [Holosporales bacterium]
MFWYFVDYCEDHLSEMTATHRRLINELLILLAPQLDIGNYTEKVVSIIGDPKLFTPGYLRYSSVLYNIFLYGTGESGMRGYGCL